MPTTALIVPVPEAEPWVADLRARFDPSAAEGVPAHVTVLVPFAPLADLDPAALARLSAALRATPAFDFTLARVGRFERTAWLAPEPAAPFVALTRAVVHAFPGWLPYGGAFDVLVPHLTAAEGDAAAAEAVAAELQARLARLARLGPLRGRCQAVELFENREPRWVAVRRFVLAEPASRTTDDPA
jgi:2'-5' RNA ligase